MGQAIHQETCRCRGGHQQRQHQDISNGLNGHHNDQGDGDVKKEVKEKNRDLLGARSLTIQ